MKTVKPVETNPVVKVKNMNPKTSKAAIVAHITAGETDTADHKVEMADNKYLLDMGMDMVHITDNDQRMEVIAVETDHIMVDTDVDIHSFHTINGDHRNLNTKIVASK